MQKYTDIADIADAPREPQTAKKRGETGFSLIEVVIVIVIIGVLSAAIAVNWSSFMRHQELRSEALGIHKEIVAQRAWALGEGKKVKIEISTTGESYIISREDGETEIEIDDPANPGTLITVTRDWNSTEVPLNNGVIISDNFGCSGNDLPLTSANGWRTDSEIMIEPDNLKAFKNGCWLIEHKNTTGRQFCIIKGDENVRPEIYYRNSAGGKWTKI
jgi:prepilin-type N-terminal cleavage/methylation domain-containing protein